MPIWSGDQFQKFVHKARQNLRFGVGIEREADHTAVARLLDIADTLSPAAHQKISDHLDILRRAMALVTETPTAASGPAMEPSVSAGEVYQMARWMGGSGLIWQEQPAQQNMAAAAAPTIAPEPDLTETEKATMAEENGWAYRRPGQYQSCAYCKRRYRVRPHFCESPYNPCDACMLCPGCMPCAECGMMDCDPRGSCEW